MECQVPHIPQSLDHNKNILVPSKNDQSTTPKLGNTSNQEGISDTKLSLNRDVDNIFHLSPTHNSTCNISSVMPTPKNNNKKPCTTDSKMIEELIAKLEAVLLKTEEFLNLPKK